MACEHTYAASYLPNAPLDGDHLGIMREEKSAGQQQRVHIQKYLLRAQKFRQKKNIRNDGNNLARNTGLC